MTGIDKKLAKRFEEFLEAGGAEILETTNAWELARFRTANGICVVYQNQKGRISSSNEYASAAMNAFHSGALWTAGEVKDRIKRKRVEDVLLERDGNACFLCGADFTPDSPPTLEHILSTCHGGNNHLSNLALAHGACNKEAANLSIVEKIRLRDALRGVFSASTLGFIEERLAQ